MKRILCLRIENQDHGMGDAGQSAGDGALGEPVESSGQCFPEFNSKPNSLVSRRSVSRLLLVDALKTVAAQCKQFTPLVGLDPDVFPQSVLLDITNVVHLFGGETALVQRIARMLHVDGWQVRTAVAHTPGAAWALAWYGGEQWGVGGEQRVGGEQWAVDGGQENVPSAQYPVLSTEYAVLSPAPCPPPPAPCPLPPSHRPLSTLPLEALRLPEPIVALLHGLGVWQIAQLEALPRRELSSRFGPELLDCLDRVTGRLPEPLPAWDPPPQFEVCWSAEFPTARRETIEAALECLTRRLAAMLTRAGRGAMRLECLLKCHAGEPLPVAVGLFRPTAWANHLAQLLQVRFESLPLPGLVDSIRLVAASTAPLELRQQEMFSEGQTRAGPHHLSGLIDRLSNRLGCTRVTRVRLIPDAQPELACRYTPLVLGREMKRPGPSCPTGPKKSSHQSDRPPLLQPRPLRLLTQPVRLPDGIEEAFFFAGEHHRIVRRLGPERIETGWWRGPPVARDYYRIETATGRCYWVFRRLPAGPWFLHGMFD